MQRTPSTGMPNMVASCLRRSWVAGEADQEVSLPSLNSATAHDGPIEPKGCVDGEVVKWP